MGQKFRGAWAMKYAEAITPEHRNATGPSGQPRPTSGILVAMTVRNCTLASSGSPAM